jgi:RNA-directed DNA polymerase
VRFSSHELCCATAQNYSRRVRLVGAFYRLPVMQDSYLLEALADAFLTGEQTAELLFNRGSRTLGRPWPWLRPLVQRYLKELGTTRPRRRDVVGFLRNDADLLRALSKYSDELVVQRQPAAPPQMRPAPAAESWNVPPIETTGDLAKWLGLSPSELRWFADLKGLGYKKNEDRLQHYHYRILKKRFGIRLIEAPKPRLKDLQRQILRWILEKVPPHPAVQGFVAGRSIQTFVAPHVGQRVVLRMDLQDFFPTFGGSRIQSFFRTMGYPEPVADLLGGICTNATPRGIWTETARDLGSSQIEDLRRFYSRPHLPQGAPTSPALANVCFYGIDCRLSALAKAAGANYTRYADDLAFSGNAEFERSAPRFGLHVAATLLQEGFTVQHRKTRIMRRGLRQHLAGLVTNSKINIMRADFDRLKATLTNCVRYGPKTQNREGRPRFRAHLEGRVAFVEMINPVKGQRLREIAGRIKWEE